MYNCAYCNERSCVSGDLTKTPRNCPTLDPDKEEIKKRYLEDEIYKIAFNSALVESEGYCKKTRVEEIMAFANKCGYQNLGIAFCVGLKNEAKIFAKILTSNGFEINSVICKNGSIPKELLNIKEEQKVRPYTYEPMCNPLGQATFLNKANTDLNILLGLCVGHDSIFIKYSNAPVTVLAAKDRVLGHNPIAALYLSESYYKKKLFPYNK